MKTHFSQFDRFLNKKMRSSPFLGRKEWRGGPVVAFLLALLLLCTAAAPSTAAASNFNATLFPAWTKNKTEWRSRLYNSLRLTPWQVQLLEGALDARDALKAPVTLAADAAVLAAADAAFAAERAKYNSTFQREVVAPLEKAANETSVTIGRARVSALNKTEIALRAGVASIAAASSSPASPSFLHPLASSPPALLLADKLNVSANAVAKRIATLTTIEQYRAAAAVAKAGASGAPAPLPAIVFGAAPEQIGTSTAVASRAELGTAGSEAGAEQLDWTPMGPDGPGGGRVGNGRSGRGGGLGGSSSPSPLPLGPKDDHPSWLVHGGEDAEIAEWVAAKPRVEAEAATESEKERALRLAEWIEAAPHSLREDFESAAEAEESGDFITISPDVR